MKKSLFCVLMGLMILFVGSSFALARHGGGQGGGGYGGGGQGGGGYSGGGGYCGGTGIPYICEGDEFSKTGGVVTAINIYGAGLGANMTIESGGSSYTIFGLGPWWFWSNNGVKLPAENDIVDVTAKEIEIGGAERIVAMSITVYDDEGEETIQLRDAKTCYPNWAGGWSRNN
jgi:hypothetical protein